MPKVTQGVRGRVWIGSSRDSRDSRPHHYYCLLLFVLQVLGEGPPPPPVASQVGGGRASRKGKRGLPPLPCPPPAPRQAPRSLTRALGHYSHQTLHRLQQLVLLALQETGVAAGSAQAAL